LAASPDPFQFCQGSAVGATVSAIIAQAKMASPNFGDDLSWLLLGDGFIEDEIVREQASDETIISSGACANINVI
jgi:hypothetical protein